MTGSAGVRVIRLGANASSPEDRVAVEEPLAIEVNGASVAVVMRTPGDDFDLVRGFLVTEQVIARAEDIASIAHCEVVPDPEAEENVVRVTLAAGVALDLARLKRNLYASSSCGVCGKATVENALFVRGRIVDDTTVPEAVLVGLPDRLRSAQRVFEETGGLHAAGLFSTSGELLAVREDVGRHNAVDKVIGWALEEGAVPLAGRVLCVSGRISFEIVQKAAAAGVPIVVAVSAPTSLAVRMAEELGVTLVGFVRGGRGNVYAHGGRVSGARS